jgi:ribonucleoside-diphosphate reductase alpha chain
MSLQEFNIPDIKKHYLNKFEKLNAGESDESFKAFLKEVVKELSWNLNIDLNLMEKDYDDQVICKTRTLGALESLNRVLLSIAESANYKATNHPDWSLLAGRIEIQRLKLQVPETYKEMIELNPNVWRNDKELNYYDFASSHADILENMMVPERDYDLYFFGVRTLEYSYLMRLIQGTKQILETPQRMYMRIAAFLWMPNLEMIKKYYDLMSTGAFTHASPTIFHSGIVKGSLASCFLLSMQDDLEKIFKCLGQCAMISKAAGGIGLDITNIRHSSVGHMGQSSGIVPMLKVYDAGMRYVDQCFDPETIVYTKMGPKAIGQVSSGEKLITMNGKFAKVGKPMHYTFNNNNEMYKLLIKNYFKPVIASGVHPMYVLKDNKENLEKNIACPEFVPVSEIDQNCFIGIPIPQYEKDLSFYDTNDCYMYGILIGNGFKVKGKNQYGINFFNNNNSNDLIIFVKDYLKNRAIDYVEKTTDEILTIKWFGGAMFPFNEHMIYNNGEKHIHHSMLHLPKEKALAVIKGLIQTNGKYNNNKDIKYYNSSSSVIEGLRYMLLRFGIGIHLSHTNKKNTKEWYCVYIPKVAEIAELFNLNVETDVNYFVWNNILFTKVIKVDKINYKKNTIVELEMEDQTEQGANYLTSIGLAHNGGRRKGSATIFLQPWHIDFPDFIMLKRQHGAEERRARDLYYAVWSCDLFMERVRNDQEWTLFCPKYAPMLRDTYGEEFEKWYLHYENTLGNLPESGNFMKKISAKKLWTELLTTQIEAGMPFMAHKDTANYTSNQKNLGLIRSSNLCMEIFEVTDENTISSCNLASIALDEYIDIVNNVPMYNYKKLGETVRLIVRGLNRVIDRTFYPLQEWSNGSVVGQGPIKSTNLKYRPLGIGVQGLADAFLKMNMAWGDSEAKELNKNIFATIYYNALDESVELAKEDGVYEGFYGSPMSKGLLKPDLIAMEKARKKLRIMGVDKNSGEYNEKLNELRDKYLETDLCKMFDWEKLRNRVKNYGIRNSLLVALMPTASSAQIRYKTESFEPFTTNMYVRSVLSGNHLIINKYMVEDLQKLGLWTKSVINFIIKKEGSIQDLPIELVAEEKRPALQRIKEKCKTAFELSQKLIVDMSIDRAYYICQSQSLNIHIKSPTYQQLTNLHFYAWEHCLSTGMYYLRTAPATEAVKFTVDGELDVEKTKVCTDEVCISCQS